MNELQTEIQIDITLTPECSKNRGFYWVKDVIVDSEAPTEAQRDIKVLINSGYSIGLSASSSEMNNLYGLYKPKYL